MSDLKNPQEKSSGPDDQELELDLDSSSSPHDAVHAESPEEVVDMLEHQMAELRDRELKAQAELENFRKRIYRETEQTLKYAAGPVIKDIVEVLDNLARASDAAGGKAASTPEAAALLEGVRMVQQQLVGVLGKHHCRPIESLGKEFDPNLHQAIAQSPSAEYPSGTVMLEATVGYVLHDRVIRPSHVIVSTGAAS
jgi:molecular chaperone GrpE